MKTYLLAFAIGIPVFLFDFCLLSLFISIPCLLVMCKVLTMSAASAGFTLPEKHRTPYIKGSKKTNTHDFFFNFFRPAGLPVGRVGRRRTAREESRFKMGEV